MLQHVFNDGGEDLFLDIDGIISNLKCDLLFVLYFNLNHFVLKVNASGRTWFEFSSRYRSVIQRIQKMRESEYRQFVFNLDQARDFLVIEKSLFRFLFLILILICIF